jgi:hypothetical protein
VVVRTVEAPGTGAVPVADVVHEFTPGLDILRSSFSDAYRERRAALRAAGRLRDDSLPPPVDVWTPGSGWMPVRR